ncbi:hypothetical protein [Aureliella helgolandensis]|uniref:hypothetical protein n=1 Tax=Aureliella helgolandensis TaxID=2527968 RepID=UPI0018D1B5FE|nr:hypothetical protein [Aureliella helgolandensis]
MASFSAAFHSADSPGVFGDHRESFIEQGEATLALREFIASKLHSPRLTTDEMPQGISGVCLIALQTDVHGRQVSQTPLA